MQPKVASFNHKNPTTILIANELSVSHVFIFQDTQIPFRLADVDILALEIRKSEPQGTAVS